MCPQSVRAPLFISTHAPLARCDYLGGYLVQRHLDFNSRTSCEVRPAPSSSVRKPPVFQLTHLLRGATLLDSSAATMSSISTHAPLARCDPMPAAPIRKSLYFNSRTSCEVRLSLSTTMCPSSGFQLTHLLRGATPAAKRAACCQRHFNSRTSCEVRLSVKFGHPGNLHFNSRTSCEVRRPI